MVLSGFSALSQNKEELNRQAKELLTKGDCKAALPFLKQAADAGQPEAQYNLGYSYQQGIEVVQDDSIANMWYMKSAKQGFADAEFKLSFSYALGRGCRKDMKAAVYWSKRCAERNDAECMYNLMNCYAQGTGVKKNTDSMLYWAVRLGAHLDVENLQISGMITNARLNLAITYRDGVNVKKDIKKGYMWFLIYNESKRDFSILEQQKNIEAIKELEKKISSSEKEKIIAKAEKQINRKLKNLETLYKEDW